MPERNKELFDRLADHFEASPGTWCQSDWGHRAECGAFACLFGWASILTYGERAWRQTVDADDPFPDLVLNFDDNGPAPRGGGQTITDHVGTLLGLTQDEAYQLSSCGWEPDRDLPDALRLLGKGADLADVTEPVDWGEDEDGYDATDDAVRDAIRDAGCVDETSGGADVPH